MIKDSVIIGLSGEVVAEIEFDMTSAVCGEGKIIKNNFPERLLFLLKEYDDIVNQGAFSCLDEIETEIYSFGLKLKSKGISKGIKIFAIRIQDDQISFYTKYPSGQGFLDDFPK